MIIKKNTQFNKNCGLKEFGINRWYNLMNKVFSLYIICIATLMPSTVFARCAICYTQGLSGASIAVIVIVLSAIFLFIANKFLQKFLEKYN